VDVTIIIIIIIIITIIWLAEIMLQQYILISLTH